MKCARHETEKKHQDETGKKHIIHQGGDKSSNRETTWRGRKQGWDMELDGVPVLKS
jgi:hypothetical protein